MPEINRLGELVFLASNSAASQPRGESSAVAYTLASLMKDGSVLIVEQPAPSRESTGQREEQA
jgi:hypothetical protein